MWLSSSPFPTFYYPNLPLFSAQSGYSAPSFSPWQGLYQGSPRIGPPHRRQSESVHLSLIPPDLLCLPTRCACTTSPLAPCPNAKKTCLNQSALSVQLFITAETVRCMESRIELVLNKLPIKTNLTQHILHFSRFFKELPFLWPIKTSSIT